MDFKAAQNGPLDFVILKGKLDYAASSDFDEKLRAILDRPGRRFFLMDFNEVTVLSSPCLRAILTMAKRLRRVSGHLIVVKPSEIALECFKISGFLKLNLFQVENDRETALKQMLEVAARAGELPQAPSEPKSGEQKPQAVPTSPLSAALAEGGKPAESAERPPNPLLTKPADAAPAPKSASKPEPESKPEPKLEPKAKPKLEPKPEPELEPKAEPKLEPKPEPKASAKESPKIAPDSPAKPNRAATAEKSPPKADSRPKSKPKSANPPPTPQKSASKPGKPANDERFLASAIDEVRKTSKTEGFFAMAMGEVREAWNYWFGKREK